MFPGLIYRPSNIPVVFLVFFSGKVVITGAKTMADVYDSWKKLHDILKNYKIIVTKAKMSDLNTTEV
jgi:transcription initiation factor TFIID TATA-box-binding protein